MRYCSILALKAAREREKDKPFFCDSELARRQKKGNGTSKALPIIFLMIMVAFLVSALAGTP